VPPILPDLLAMDYFKLVLSTLVAHDISSNIILCSLLLELVQCELTVNKIDLDSECYPSVPSFGGRLQHTSRIIHS